MIGASCLCGGVRFEFRRAAGAFELCHCNRCRKVSGSAFLAGLGIRREDFRWISGRDLIETFDAPILHEPPAYKSCFCRRCGSPTPDPTSEGPWIEIPAGLVDGDPGRAPERHIMVEHKSAWYSIVDALPQLDEAALRALRSLPSPPAGAISRSRPVEPASDASFEIRPIGYVRGGRAIAEDDHWGGQETRIELAPELDARALSGLDAFSHAEILFLFHRVDPSRIETTARRPRGNAAWPEVGIFAQRGRSRPNRLGSTIVRIARVDGRNLYVRELDAIDGTPVVDIKPVMVEFLPRADVRQPQWSRELMQHYWDVGE